MLRNILDVIAYEVNKNPFNDFQIFKDNAFLLNNYFFEDFEESIKDSHLEVQQLQGLFLKFCKINNIEPKETTSIFDFIDKSKVSLSQYLSNTKVSDNKDFTVEAQFISFFKDVPNAFEWIKKIYLGSIISSYLEYKTDNNITDVELLFDTNFIISLIDLNTPESKHTCSKLIEIGKKQGYKFSVLKDTIEESQILLRKKAEYFNQSFLQSIINPEDIYNACSRRGLAPSDLERTADNLEELLLRFDIITIPNTLKYQNLAKNSNDYENLKPLRNTERAALHDATAIHYVRVKRENRFVYDFEKVKCWFVHNSNQGETQTKLIKEKTANQPEVIKADELLNIIWLSNPAIDKTLNQNDITDIGLTSLVAFTLNNNLPKSSIIKELDENIRRFAQEEIADKDILLISTRIVNRQLKDVKNLNDLAQNDKEAFVKRLKEEASIQRKEDAEKKQKFDNLLIDLTHALSTLNNEKDSLLEREEEQKRQGVLEVSKMNEKYLLEKARSDELEAQIKESKRAVFYKSELDKWRRPLIYEAIIFIVIFSVGLFFLFSNSDWDMTRLKDSISLLQSFSIIPFVMTIISLIFGAFLIPSYLLKYRNHSNIKAYKEGLKLPQDLL